MIEKRNVVDGTVKTAEADNEEDAIGKAAASINKGSRPEEKAGSCPERSGGDGI